MPAATRAQGGGPLDAAASLLDRLRWLFLPLSMGALLAVGIHAAADALSDPFLTAVDRVDALFDALFSQWSVTAPLVDLVGLSERTYLARGAALVLELWANLLVALPALGFADQGGRSAEWARARDLLRRAVQRPSTLRLTRAPFAAAFALAGSVSVARLCEGTLFAALRPLFGSGAGLWLARSGSLAVLLVVLTSVAWRAALRALEHADERSEAKARTQWRRLRVGLVSAALLAPLALAAVLRAAPVASFFR